MEASPPRGDGDWKAWPFRLRTPRCQRLGPAPAGPSPLAGEGGPRQRAGWGVSQISPKLIDRLSQGTLSEAVIDPSSVSLRL